MRSKLLWSLVGAATAITAYVHREPGTDPGVGALQEAADAAIAQTDPDDILIDLRDNATPEIIAQIESDLGIKLQLVSDQSADEQFYRAKVDPSRRDLVLAALEKRPEVEIAEPDAMYSLLPGEVMTVSRDEIMQPGFPNDPLYKKQWHMRQIGMPEAWKLADGNGITVAVLDTGVAYEDFEHFKLLEDLRGIEFVDGWDFVGNDEHANDDHAHGSHVTGTIAQVTNNGIGVTGVARNVKIMPLKVLSGSGSGSVAGIADAIRYAADKGAKVMNMSLGGAFPSRVLKKAVEYAHAKGVTVICAAGNESRNKVGYPAAYPGAVAVSATQTDEDITFYSNTGKDIDIAAPGGNTRDSSGGRNNPDGGVLQNTIATNQPGKAEYAAYMGTSMASPHVAGVAALVVGEGVTDPKRVEKILKDTARKPANGKKFTAERYGAGIVDAPAAVIAAKKDAGGNGWQLMLGLLMAGAVAASARVRGLAVKLGPSYLGGVVLGASGLFFLPSLAPSLASLPVIETLTRGLPSWDLSLLGPLGHGNALFFSALIPLAALAIGYGVPKARAPLAGLAIGVAAHLLFFAVAPMMTLHWVPGVFGLASMWLVLNAVACVLLARLALRR